MNVALWIVAGLLAAVALAGGLTKTLVPMEKLTAAPGARWTALAGTRVVRTLGTLEILAAVGLILPAALDVVPVLVPLAALGLVALMVGAAFTHARRKEAPAIAMALVLLVLAALVVVGRFGPESFTA